MTYGKRRVVIEVSGGLVQAVFADQAPEIEVIVVDYDRFGPERTYHEPAEPMDRLSTASCRELRRHQEREEGLHAEIPDRLW